MSRPVKINFTRSDLDEMFTKIEESEEAPDDEPQLEVFNWSISNCDITITVGPDA